MIETDVIGEYLTIEDELVLQARVHEEVVMVAASCRGRELGEVRDLRQPDKQQSNQLTDSAINRDTPTASAASRGPGTPAGTAWSPRSARSRTSSSRPPR